MGVVHRQCAARRGDHGFDLLDGVGYVEVNAIQFGDCAVLELLHPVLEFIHTLDGAVGVGIQDFDNLLDRPTGGNLPGGVFHFGIHPGQLFPAPVVGVEQIEFDAVVHAGGEGVAFLSDGVLVGCSGDVCLTEKAGYLGDSPVGGLCGGAQVGLYGLRLYA